MGLWKTTRLSTGVEQSRDACLHPKPVARGDVLALPVLVPTRRAVGGPGTLAKPSLAGARLPAGRPENNRDGRAVRERLAALWALALYDQLAVTVMGRHATKATIRLA